MPELAIALYVVMPAVTFGWRSYMQLSRTGSVGCNGTSGAPVSDQQRVGVATVAQTTRTAPVRAGRLRAY